MHPLPPRTQTDNPPERLLPLPRETDPPADPPNPPRWIYLGIFLFLILLIAGAGIFYFSHEKQRIKAERQKELTLISELKADQIVRWLAERKDDGEVLQKNPFLSYRVKQFLKNPKSFEIKQELLSWMASLLRARDYRNTFLLSPDGRTVLIGGDEEEQLGETTQGRALEALRSRKVIVTDLVQDAPNRNIHLDVLVPILQTEGSPDTAAGLIVLRIDPYGYLYPLLKSWPTPSPTAENLLLRREGDDLLCLNVLRHFRDTAFVLKIPVRTGPRSGTAAVSLLEGVFELQDYRSLPVLASFHKIAHSRWYLLSKIDTPEIYLPIRERAELIILLGVLLTLVAGTSLGFIWRNQRTLYYRSRYEIELARKKTEQAWRESEANYRAIFDAANDAIFLHDAETGAILDLNRKGCELYGYTVEEVRRLDVGALSAGIPPYCQEDALRWVTAAREGEPQLFEWLAKDKSGRYFWVEVNLKQAAIGGEERLLAAVRDITDRKRGEEESRRLQERLQRAEKMEALGTLAGGVAHDLNNVLGVLVGYSELMMMDIPEGNPQRLHAANIWQAGQRAAAIIQDLLTLARRGVPVSEIVNLNRVIANFLELPEFDRIKAYHNRVDFQVDLDPELLNIQGSPIHLSKTVMNLVSNAAEAVAGPGVVTIKTENRYIDQPIPGYEETREGEYVVLRVADTGMGISATDLERIFEPFYTKKVMGRSGTGLGLAVVWGTVKDHNGYVDVHSEEGKGSDFILYFPVTREVPADQSALPPRSEYLGRGESLLVVDDVREQRDLAAAMLSSLGYRVETVASGEEAIEHLKTRPADLLVLDMIMDPGLDGLDTYQQILKGRPGQRAVIVSGFSETDRVRQAQALGAGAYIRKPYLLEKIGMAVRKELDRQR